MKILFEISLAYRVLVPLQESPLWGFQDLENAGSTFRPDGISGNPENSNILYTLASFKASNERSMALSNEDRDSEPG